MVKQLLLSLFLILLIPSTTLAHPGNTAADGCHYCRTNCAKWGEVEGARHCHGGASAPVVVPEPVQQPVITQPVVTPIPVVITPAPTPRPTIPPTPFPTSKPTPLPTPTPTPTIEPTIAPVDMPTFEPTTAVAQTLDATTAEEVNEGKGVWGWILGWFGF